MDVEMLGHLLVDRVQELLELDRPMASMAFAGHFSGRDVECSEQGRRAVSDVVVGLTSRRPGRIGRSGCVRSSA
jgi:hypothetical protein